MPPKREGVGASVLGFKSFPVVLNVDEFSGDVVGAFGGEKERQLDLLIRRNASGEADPLGGFYFGLPGIVSGVEDFIGRIGIGLPGENRIDLHVVIPHLSLIHISEPTRQAEISYA